MWGWHKGGIGGTEVALGICGVAQGWHWGDRGGTEVALGVRGAAQGWHRGSVGVVGGCLGVGGGGSPPAVKSVLEEIEERFLHHVGDLRRAAQMAAPWGGGGRRVAARCHPICYGMGGGARPQPPPPHYLVSLEGRPHQHHGPHGGHHIIGGDVLRLGWGGTGAVSASAAKRSRLPPPPGAPPQPHSPAPPQPGPTIPWGPPHGERVPTLPPMQPPPHLTCFCFCLALGGGEKEQRSVTAP